MATKEDLLKELEIQIETIHFKYVNLFKNSGQDLKSFFEQNGSNMRRDIASESTNTLHQGIMNNVSEPDLLKKL